MRPTTAVLLLLAASALPLAAHADTVDVMTVTGNGHTWTFDFPQIVSFTYPTGLGLFIPTLTPLSATLDGASITPTPIGFHPLANLTGPFGQIIGSGGPLDVLSSSGPYTNPMTSQTYYAYTATWFIGGPYVAGTETIFDGNSFRQVYFTLDMEPQSTTATPEPSSLYLLATAGVALLAGGRRLARP